MTTEELYSKIGGNYNEAKGRLSMDKLITRFIIKFAHDKSIPDLIAAYERQDAHECFEAAHRAKGVCGNLALTRLAELSSTICEAYRAGNESLLASTDVDALFAELKDCYATTVEAIGTFEAEQ